MSRALIAIGVSKSGSLPFLAGAIQDAEEIASWATRQGYEFVKSFTDKDNGEVEFDPIYAWIDAVLSKGDLERLIVSFSGHGYAPLNGHEVWLLSGWEENGNEAINASGSITYAQAYASPQISFFADACRTTWSTNAPPYGQVLLPKPGSRAVASQVDQFYATKFGFVSQEGGEGVKSFGVFSSEVRKALSGSAPAWIERGGRRLVTSRSLEDYLDDAVPEASGILGVVQQPDTLPQWREPRDVYVDLGVPPAVLHRGAAPQERRRPTPPKVVRAARQRQEQAIADDKKRFLQSEGRKSFETRTGVTVVGAEILRIIGVDNCDIFEERGAWHVRARNSAPRVALLELLHSQFEPPVFAAIAIYPELIATAVVDESGVSSLNYAPSLTSWQGSQRTPQSIDATFALAEATAYLRHGQLLPRERLLQVVELLRNDKFENPALAIVAANICHRTGDWATINDMLDYPIGRGPYTPYDLVVLGGHVGSQREVIGVFPLLSSTWGALATSDFDVDQRLRDVVKEITPSLWTVATPAGAEMLEELMSAHVGAHPFATP